MGSFVVRLPLSLQNNCLYPYFLNAYTENQHLFITHLLVLSNNFIYLTSTRLSGAELLNLTLRRKKLFKKPAKLQQQKIKQLTGSCRTNLLLCTNPKQAKLFECMIDGTRRYAQAEVVFIFTSTATVASSTRKVECCFYGTYKRKLVLYCTLSGRFGTNPITIYVQSRIHVLNYGPT